MAETCGAKTRSGAKCKSRQMANGRCRMHGGTSKGAPKNNTNAVTHGIFVQKLTKEEEESYANMKPGNVDDEIRLTRILLGRALIAENIAQGRPELEEVTKNEGGGAALPKVARKYVVRDYDRIIDRMISRIASLEKARLILIKGANDLNEGADDFNDRVIGFEVVPYEEGDQ